MGNDRSIENAMISSLNNPRHCLYYEEPDDRTKIAKTLVNSNEIYELKTRKKYEKCIQRHEENHIVACLQTHFRRMIIIESLRFPFGKLFPEKTWSSNHNKIETIYNNEIRPMLETFALFHQLKIAPADLREQLVIEAQKEPLLFQRLRWLEEILNKIMEKNITHNVNPFLVYGNLASITFSSLNVEKEKIADRLRILREIDVPRWQKDSDLMRYIIDYFHEKGLSITLTPYGTTESVFSAALFLQVIKNISKMIPEEFLGDYVLGILSEIDVQIGPISYTCNSLDTLEGRRIKYCYLGSIAQGNDFFIPLELTRDVIRNLLSTKKLDAEDRQLLLDFDEDLNKLSLIKREVFQNCAGPQCCRGKADCILRPELGQRVVNSILAGDEKIRQ